MDSGESSQVLMLGADDPRFVTPWELPNGDVMFSDLSRGRIEVFDGGTRHRVHEVTGATVEGATYAPTGHVVWAQWGANEGVWAAPFSLGTNIELGAGAPPGNTTYPEWFPDSSRIVYLAGPTQSRAVLMEDAAGSAIPVTVVAEGARNGMMSVSADGRYVLFGGTDGDIWYVEVDGGQPVRFRQTDDLDEMPALSPDGRYIAYGRISPHGTSGLFIERFPEGGGLQAVATDVWDDPHWSSDGRVLYYEGLGLMAVQFDPDTGALSSRSEILFEGLTILGGYDVTSDGEFIVPRAETTESATATRLPILIENWPKLLEQR